ncbi:MAG TPA: protein kinase [Ktedonobacteraceae bacterium]|nr:protein kinase [Ktedonobacteraceae bacterium]
MQLQNRVGQVLGNYRLTSSLGQGGYAEVYQAENIHLDIKAAIKVLKSRVLQDIEQEQFRNEAKLIASLNHPNIVKILDYGIENNKHGLDSSTPYLVMEYAPLGTLRHLYPQGTAMPLPEVASYIKQVAQALQFAHEHNPVIVHRDVKPENILVRRPGDVILSDFGIAIEGLATRNLQIQIEQMMQKMARNERIDIAGTAPYIAPERLQGHTQRASDQYSLAVIAYEWLCGQRPFNGKDDMEICAKHLSSAPPSLHSSFPSISQEVEQVVLKGLAKAPADRYSTVLEFAVALEKAIQASTRSAAPPSQPVLPKQFPGVGQPAVKPLEADPAKKPQPSGPIPVMSPPTQPPAAQPRVYHAVPPQQQGGQSRGAQNPNLPSYQGPMPGPGSLYGATTQGAHAPLMPGNSPTSLMAELENLAAEPVQTVKRVFVTDRYFLRTYRNRWFLPLGIALNIVAALIVGLIGPLATSLMIAAIGAVVAIFCLYRCIVSVKKPIAYSFAAIVAIWWGYVIGSIAYKFSPSSTSNVPLFLLGLAISLGIHGWYIENRLKN